MPEEQTDAGADAGGCHCFRCSSQYDGVVSLLSAGPSAATETAHMN